MFDDMFHIQMLLMGAFMDQQNVSVSVMALPTILACDLYCKMKNTCGIETPKSLTLLVY
jgi:hypothetical protein